TVREIHDLTGGRPYEIQLLCHAMFRRIQERRSKIMDLGISVLDDVRRELASTQNMSDRPVLTGVRTLSSQGFRALSILGRCCKYSTFEDVWKVEFLAHGYERWTREGLRDCYDSFLSLGILKEEAGKILFDGDDFDRIYIKY